MEALINIQIDLNIRIRKARVNFKKSPIERITKRYVETRLESLEQLWFEFKAGHKELVKFSDPSKLELESYMKEDMYDTTEDIYVDHKCELLELLQTGNDFSESGKGDNVKSTHIKLPKISIPNFSGKYTEWTSFRDLFVSMIHKNDTLDKVQKLHYLKGYLVGEAEQLVRHISISESNYDQCWKLLENRYNNKKFLSQCILKRLFSQKNVTIESANYLKDLLDTSTECLNALSNIGIDISSWDIIVIYILTLKLDPESRKHWELSVTANTTSDVLPTFKQFQEFLTNRYRALEFIEPNNKRADYKNPIHHDSVKKKVLHATNTFNVVCEYCAGNHKLCFCKKFISESYEKRYDFVFNNRICFNCLGGNHSVKFCQKSTNCKICKKRHHSLLHPGNSSTVNHSSPVLTVNPVPSTSSSDKSNTQPSSSIITCFSKNKVTKQVLLPTALVGAKSRTGEYQVVRALIDQGSQSSFITEATVQGLGLKKIPCKGNIHGIGGDNSSVASKYKVLLKLKSLPEPTYEIEVEVYVLSKITTYLPTTRVSTIDWMVSKNITLADPHFDTPNKIDALLGAEVYCQIIRDGVLRGKSGSPIAQSTALGWILSGSVNSVAAENNKFVSMHTHIEEDILKRFWELESEGLNSSNKMLTQDEEKCEQIFTATTKRDDTGRYIVKLPFRDDNPVCQGGNSRKIAIQRFKNLERKFEKNDKLKKDYINSINEYLSLKHMALVGQNDGDVNQSVYLPHHPVIREDRTTTKMRIVFDASCKNEKGVSLNDCLLTGPTLQPDLRYLVLRWRSYPVCLIADIVKMYRMVKIADEDARFQRIVWRESPESQICDYKLLTVTFGTSSAPFLAVRALQQISYDEGDKYPLAAMKVINEFYMDDFMSGGQSVEEALELYNQMNALLKKGGFVLQKWSSNREEIIKEIQKERELQGNVEDGKENVEIKTDNTIKILGLTWNRSNDEFQYTVKLPSICTPVTKRQIISDIARLYDPLGWIAPCVIVAKVFIQKLWLTGLEWDEQVQNSLLNEWLTYRSELSQLVDFRIPRWLHTKIDDPVVELHGFSDASHTAYAAVVYVRVIDNKGCIHVSLIGAKTRVAPIKQISIPRLELCGAVLLAKLLVEIAQVLQIPISQIRAWTDSTVVLAWLNKHPSNWKTFVANRVSEILNMLDSSHWYHVSTKQNPADCASRGLSPLLLVTHELWKSGPKFLWDENIVYNRLKDNFTSLEESVKTYFVVINNSIIDKYSSLIRLIRVVAFCRRFITKKDPRYTSHSLIYLQKWELDDALTCCVRLCQMKYFAQEISEIDNHENIKFKNSKIKILNPFIDEKDVLRVGGRIEASQVDDNVKHPIILPHDSHLTELVIDYAHQKTLHGGLTLMLNYLRTAYWIVGAKNAVKRHIRKCVPCIRNKANVQNPFMGSLPTARVTPMRAFNRSGVDMAGPITLRTSKGRGHRSYKGYICLFVCMVTRAVHIEAVSDLTSRGFLNAFKRFVSRRGHCSELWSDNGSNFIGAAKELKHLFDVEKSTMLQEVADVLATNNTTWHFIPPYTPNFGGLWEAGIKSTKFHIKRVIGTATLTYEEMATLLSQVEACLNSRPISVISNDPEEPVPLTPGHFLIGESLVNVPSINYEHEHMSSLQRWQLIQRILQNFWRRWSNEYLTHCMQRYKWANKIPEPCIGDVVLIKEDDLPPTKWLLGRIVQKHPGTDNVTRVVTLKCKNSWIKRPVSKLCVLPVNEDIL